MKKVISIVIILVLFYSMVGYYIDFKIEQFQLKESIKERLIKKLPDNELTLLKISHEKLNRLNWTEEGREFRYEGNMYDVVKIKIVGDTAYYYCFNDEKENKLITSVDKLIKEQTHNTKSKNSNKKPVINYFFNKSILSFAANETIFHYFDYSPIYTSLKPDILSPPPKAS